LAPVLFHWFPPMEVSGALEVAAVDMACHSSGAKAMAL